MTDRFDSLSPRDTVITLRSLRRRFQPVADAASSERLSPHVDAPGPAGDSLATLAVEAAQTAALLANDVERALDHDEPLISRASLEPSDRVFTERPEWSVAGAVTSLIDDAERAAERIDLASGGELARTVPVAGGSTTTPLGLAHELARSALASLKACDAQVDWMRANAH